MQPPLRNTRRRIAYWLMLLLSVIVGWMAMPGDIGQIESSLAMLLVPSIVGGIMTFITSETYSDHSERKNKKDAN